MSQDPDEHSSSFFSRISPGGEILDVEKAAGEVSCAFSRGDFFDTSRS